MTLLKSWEETVSRYSDAVAVEILASGETWTFRQLDELAGGVEVEPVMVASFDGGVDFFARVIAAVKAGVAVLPLEEGVGVPVFGSAPPEGTAVIKRTAVGTGEVEMILLDEKSQIAEWEMLCGAFDLGAHRTAIAAVSPAHSYGFGVLVLPMLLAGMRLAVPEGVLQPSIRAALDQVGRGRDVFLPGVPTIWKGWARSGILKGFEGLAMSAGSPLTPELGAEVDAEMGSRLINLYGTSETGAVSYCSSDAERETSGDVGVPLPGISVEVDEESGRLRVWGMSVGMGYWDGGEGFCSFGDDGILTWDVGRMDSAGGIRLEGFAGETVNVSGRKVSPRRVERIAKDVLGVGEVRVFGVKSRDSERWEDLVLAVGKELSAAEIRAELSSHLYPWEVPRLYWCCSPEEWGASDQSTVAWRERFRTAGR